MMGLNVKRGGDKNLVQKKQTFGFKTCQSIEIGCT
jgi:hypothetical protein